MHKWIKTLFAFSKGERIGLAVLIILLALVITLPYFIPSHESIADYDLFKQKIDSLSQLAKTIDKEEKTPDTNSTKTRSSHVKTYSLFAFDPNTADAATFEQLGFSPKQAAAIVNYRTKGGVFRTPDDFKKIYVVTPEWYERLKPYIRINIPEKQAEYPKQDSDKIQKKQLRDKIDLNSADTAALLNIRGIGMVTARQILHYRKQLGGFACVEQLLEIKGMNDERLIQIAPQVTVDTSYLIRINLQTADESTLKKHPYIGGYAARGIIHFRNIHGHCDIDALVKNNVLDAEKANRLKPYCMY